METADTGFSEFMQARWTQLVRLGYGLTGDRQLAEDLAQTALARAYASWPRVQRSGNPDAYVRRIMINANHGRFRKHRVTERLTDAVPEPGGADLTGQQDDRSALLAALLTLPYGQRAVVVLRYWMDMTETETAAALGCSVGNVKSQASRALAKLRLGSVGVTRLRMTLANHQSLTLRPVRWHGHGWVAVLLPLDAKVDRVVAYSGQRELKYAVPYAGGVPDAWLRPGQRGLPRRTVRVATLSRHSVVIGQAGPWGVCLVDRLGRDDVDSACDDGHKPALQRAPVTNVACVPSPGYVIGAARQAVARLRFTFSGGQPRELRPVSLDGIRYFAFATASGERVLRWTAYDAAGHQLGSGQGKDWLC